MSLETVIDEVMSNHPRSSNRLDPLADYAISQLLDFGLPEASGGSEGEVEIQGLARQKDWDVSYNFAGKPRLLLSLKSIWSNAGGTVPNRIDDLMGEAANVQQMSPEVVIGYILLFDAQADANRRADNLQWSGYFEQRVQQIAIREAPIWNQGLLEGTWFIRFDSEKPVGERIINPAKVDREREEFFQSLLKELKIREPAIPFTEEINSERE
jgi:hypothetical protein